MQIRTMLNYGLRIVIFLAMNDNLCSSRKIADETGVPRDYLIQIAQLLRKGDIIDAVAGKNGGYKLSRPADEITLHEILSVFEEDAKPADAVSDSEAQSPTMQKIFGIIDGIATSHDEHFDSITLKDAIEM